MPFLAANWILGFACAWVFFAMGRLEARDAAAAHRGLWWALASQSAGPAWAILRAWNRTHRPGH